MSEGDICEYFRKHIADTHEELQTDSFWLVLRDNLSNMLGFQTNFYKRELYENKIRIDYVVKDGSTSMIHKPHYTVQKILIIGDPHNSTDSFHFQTQMFKGKCISSSVIIIFFYPEFEKILIFQSMNPASFTLVQLNWNWFYTMDYFIGVIDNVRCNMHLTLTTGTSAMPNGICNVFIPRFEYAFKQKKTKRINSNANTGTNYPISNDLYMTFEEILVSDLAECTYFNNSFVFVSDMSRVELGSIHELIGLEQDRIQKRGNQFLHSALIHSIRDIIRKKNPYWCFGMDGGIFYANFEYLSEAPNILTFEAILELDCCILYCEIPFDIIPLLLQAIGQMMW